MFHSKVWIAYAILISVQQAASIAGIPSHGIRATTVIVRGCGGVIARAQACASSYF